MMVINVPLRPVKPTPWLQMGPLHGARDGTTLALPAFEKKFPSIYISIKNIHLALKLIYLAPLSKAIYKLTHETKNEKKLSNHPLSVPRISRETFR